MRRRTASLVAVLALGVGVATARPAQAAAPVAPSPFALCCFTVSPAPTVCVPCP